MREVKVSFESQVREEDSAGGMATGLLDRPAKAPGDAGGDRRSEAPRETGSARPAEKEHHLTPRLLLDVDGVVNAVTRQPGSFWSEWRTAKATPGNGDRGFTITWAPAVAEFLRTLLDRGVEIVWLTTWGRWANEAISPLLDLPKDLKVAGEPMDYAGEGWWKLPLAQHLWSKDQRPFIWIDDDLAYTREAKRWLATLPMTEFLAICPSSAEGIHPRHIERIEVFLTAMGC